VYKNLNPKALGVSGRQSELIELALTYGFRGMDVDMADLAKRARVNGTPQAIRFLDSAKIRIGGFDLPIAWKGDDSQFKTQLEQFAEAASVAAALKAHRCILTVAPACDTRPFQENFEFHRQRIGQMADVVAKQGIRIGLAFQSLRSQREGKQFQFIYETDSLPPLVRTINAKNVGVVVDTFHWMLGGGSIDQIVSLQPDQVVGVRLADYSRDEDVDKFDERSRRIPGEGGGVDCQAIVNSLAQRKYDGPLTLFTHASLFRGNTREWIVQRAANVLDELWRGAGLVKPKPAAAGSTE